MRTLPPSFFALNAFQSYLLNPASRAVGRRAVYLRSLPCLCIGSVGVAMSHEVPTLMFWRVVQALGASSGMSVGAGVIGDIYKLDFPGACARSAVWGTVLKSVGRALGARRGEPGIGP